jgi:hypothetical protein
MLQAQAQRAATARGRRAAHRAAASRPPPRRQALTVTAFRDEKKPSDGAGSATAAKPMSPVPRGGVEPQHYTDLGTSPAPLTLQRSASACV